ncbi:Acetyl-coenzyme A synthetase [Streptomyces tendae]
MSDGTVVLFALSEPDAGSDAAALSLRAEAEGGRDGTGRGAGAASPSPDAGRRIINGIGATELLHIFVSAADEDIRPGTTGVPVPGWQARVQDGNGVPVPDGEPGLLAVRGPVGCRYLADPRQREYVRDGWNVTGDTYVREPGGYFRYVARADDMIISAGYNIAGPEVEDALLRHPDVVEAAVVGRPDRRRGQVVVAHAVLKEGAERDANAPPGSSVGAGALQVPAGDRLPGRAAAHGHRQAPALPAPGPARPGGLRTAA